MGKARKRIRKRNQRPDRGTRISDGTYTYKSKLELRIAENLRNRNVAFEYETLLIPYTVPEKHKNYRPDFNLANGVIVEVKGRFTATDRQKMLMVKQQNPDKDIRMLFSRNHMVGKNKNCGDWCDKHGFPWAVGDVPDRWVNQVRDR